MLFKYSGKYVNIYFDMKITFPGLMAWKQDAIQHSWDHLSSDAFPPFALLWQVLSRVRLSIGLSLVLVALLWPQKEWFTNLVPVGR